MKNSVRGSELRRTGWSIGVQLARCGLVLAMVVAAGGSSAFAHTPVVDASLSDWCVGAFSNTKPGGGRLTEDVANTFTCGNCSVTTDLACFVATDCPAGEACLGGTKRELAWWDDATDGAVNDLATVAMTWDATNLYIAAELWVDPDPVSLPFGQITIDFAPGGHGTWHDPNGLMVQPGNCTGGFTDRACTSDADCHFCMVSQEPVTPRRRTCGSGCDPNNAADICDMTESCINLGAARKPFVGRYSVEAPMAGPRGDAEFLIAFDFSLWLISAGDAVLLMQPGETVGSNADWVPVTGCPPDFVGDNDWCDFPPAVNPGASGGSGGPPGSVEVAIPWSAFAGCTGCTPGFQPSAVPPFDPPLFRFNMVIARGTLSLDFTPDGAIEDVLSEKAANVSSLTPDTCTNPPLKIANTACEIAEKYGSADSSIERRPDFGFGSSLLAHETMPGGRTGTLFIDKAGAGLIELDWGTSCSAADNDFGVYQGTIASLTGGAYDHAPVAGACPNGGPTSATFVPAAGSSYYLVVPLSGAGEGSYGEDSTGAERPQTAGACGGAQANPLGNCF